MNSNNYEREKTGSPLILIGGWDPVKNLVHFVSRFPLLEDLDLAAIKFAGRKPHQPFTPPDITTPPPLDGTLGFRVDYPSTSLVRSAASIPGGIHFRSVEMKEVRRGPLQVILNACSSTLESITFGSGLSEYPRFRAVSRTGTYPSHKRELNQISGIVLFSNGSGMVFRVEPIDPLDRFLPKGPGSLLRLEPCRWDTG